jgi:hypothetical protein
MGVDLNLNLVVKTLAFWASRRTDYRVSLSKSYELVEYAENNEQSPHQMIVDAEAAFDDLRHAVSAHDARSQWSNLRRNPFGQLILDKFEPLDLSRAEDIAFEEFRKERKRRQRRLTLKLTIITMLAILLNVYFDDIVKPALHLLATCCRWPEIGL